MDTTVAILACCLLALFPLAQTENGTSTVTSPTESSTFNQTHVTTAFTSSNSTVNATTALNTAEGTTQYANTSPAQVTSSTENSTESASSSPIPQSSTSSSPVTHTTGTQSSTVSVPTTEASQTTVKYTSTPTTPHSSHSVATTSGSERKTQGFGLNISEKRLTIVFSVILGTVVVIVTIVLMFRKCKHKIQYLHQPLNNVENPDGFAADGDTLVISGGLYDGHPIYDNLPPPSEDQSQFRLEFLH